ncbi:MAG: replicative DNA helicase [Flavobacteriales bacterium]|nr:replicative DNA helicase [Flavobacteriales bacterium]
MAYEPNTKYRKQQKNLEEIVFNGKLQPQALDLEAAVLGAMMLEKNAPEKVLDILKPEIFYSDSNKLIFSAIADLFTRAQPIDLLTVTETLRKSGNLELAGGAFGVTQLTNKVVSAANLEYHTHILIQKYIQRQMINIAGEIGKKAFEDTTDAFELLDDSERKLFAIKNDTMKKGHVSLGDILHKAIKNIEFLKNNDQQMAGIPSGLSQIDKVTGGWQKSDLIIIAGRPGMGKTAFVVSIARNAAIDFKKPVALFSLEMSAVQLVTRLISSESEISSEKIRKGDLADSEWEILRKKTEKLSEAPIFIDDTPSLSIFDFKAKARRLKSQHNIELIIVDYLQLMKGDDKNIGNREQEISYISRSLKALAKELDIPVIALAQLSRAAERRTDNKPQLSDLRESGSIEQDADLVGFIYRAEYYGISDEEGISTHGIGEFIIQKHRNGPTDTIKMRYQGEFTKFSNLDDTYVENFSFTDRGEDTGSIIRGSRMNDMPSNYDDDLPDNIPF